MWINGVFVIPRWPRKKSVAAVRLSTGHDCKSKHLQRINIASIRLSQFMQHWRANGYPTPELLPSTHICFGPWDILGGETHTIQVVHTAAFFPLNNNKLFIYFWSVCSCLCNMPLEIEKILRFFVFCTTFIKKVIDLLPRKSLWAISRTIFVVQIKISFSEICGFGFLADWDLCRFQNAAIH